LGKWSVDCIKTVLCDYVLHLDYEQVEFVVTPVRPMPQMNTSNSFWSHTLWSQELVRRWCPIRICIHIQVI